MTLAEPLADSKNAAIRRRVLISTISNVANKLLSLAVWFLLTPFILRQLGPSIYGLWVLVSSVVAYGNLLDFGVAQAVTKYVADFQARGQLAQAQPLVATALWLYLLLGAVAVALSVGLALVFPSLFAIPPDQRALAQMIVILAGLSLGVSLPSAATVAVLRGLQRFDLSSLVGALGTLLFAGATLAVLLSGGGVLGLVALNIPVTLLMQVPTIWLIRRAAPEFAVGLRGASRRLVRMVFSYSSALFVINVAGHLQSRTDEVVIGAFLPVANVTPYSLARRLSDLPNSLTDQFMRVLMPLSAQLHAEDDRQRLRALYLTSTRLTLALGLPMVIILSALSGPFLALWLGPDYSRYAPLVMILAAASLVDTIQWPASNILQGMARHRPLALVALGTGLGNLMLSIWLVRPFGITGVALGTLIPAVIESVGLLTPYAMRQLSIPARTAASEMLWPPVAAAVPLAAVLWVLTAWLQPASYLMLAVIGAVGLAAFGLPYIALTRGQPEHGLLKRAAERLQAWIMARRPYPGS